jgi:two-component system NtrC family sensor kinase
LKNIREFFSTPFQLLLVVSFSMVAAIAIAIGFWAISQTIGDYLSEAMNERVARDMQLAQAFYDLQLREIEGLTDRLSRDPLVIENLTKPEQAGSTAIIDQQITGNLAGLTQGGNHLAAILDKSGKLVGGQLLLADGSQNQLLTGVDLHELEIFQQAMTSEEQQSGTEIIPAELLAKVGLEQQAQIDILDTPRAAPELFDPREGSAGITLLSGTPIRDAFGNLLGVAVAFHMFNNDFTLVDRIKEVAGIDTATLFLGDLRVSTNVMAEEGERAIGTRLSEEVSQVVLEQGKEYVGPAFVVNEDYITRYDPLRNRAGQVIGILYVGVRQAYFQRLVTSLNNRVILVSIATILLTILIATPVSRTITRPLNQLKDLVAASRQVAAGDMSVRVPVRAGGEVGLLTSSFNTMLDNLQTAQDQLVQSEKLASLGQLAAGVAHELNNPLGTILLYSDILLKELGPDSPYRADLEVIVNETKRCKGIVAALLEFARQNQVVAQPMDLNALIRNVVEMSRKQYESRSIQIQLDLDQELPIIQADQNQLQQVIVNLIENARDALPSGGTVSIRTRNGPIGMVTLEVSDNGMGIAPENLSKLFTPFFTTKPIGIGTGLGLAIIYGIIKLHRGQINVRSELEKGTTFTINLPIKHQGTGNQAGINFNQNRQM